MAVATGTGARGDQAPCLPYFSQCNFDKEKRPVGDRIIKGPTRYICLPFQITHVSLRVCGKDTPN
jgi:hypothetical protein